MPRRVSLKTLGMGRSATVTFSPPMQQAVVPDCAANIAAGANILADTWNRTRAGGLTVNNGEPQYLENWFFALWAQNSGKYQEADAAEKSGTRDVCFTDNPADPL